MANSGDGAFFEPPEGLRPGLTAFKAEACI